MSKIGLIDCDICNNSRITSRFPNLALMKIAGYHIDVKRAEVELFKHGNAYDKVYASKVFSFNSYEFPPIANLETGGSAFDMHKNLPDEIEHCKPRYSLYPNVRYSVGFYTRGCIKKCSFCIVNEKEGMLRRHSDLAEWVEPKYRDILCLDNNILAEKAFFDEIFEEKTNKFPKHNIIFRQGLDKFYINRESVEMLRKMNARKITIACDHQSELTATKKTIDLLRVLGQRITVYVLIKDITQVHTIVELGNYGMDVYPFAMYFLGKDSDSKINKRNTLEEIQIKNAKWKVNYPAIFNNLRKHKSLTFENLISPISSTYHIS
jgi:hypothetical protein